jgi:hypothetical protein
MFGLEVTGVYLQIDVKEETKKKKKDIAYPSSAD